MFRSLFVAVSLVSAFLPSFVSSQGVAESYGTISGRPTDLQIYPYQALSTTGDFLVVARPPPNPACTVTATFALASDDASYANGLLVQPSFATFSSAVPAVNVTITTIAGKLYAANATVQLLSTVTGCDRFGGYSWTPVSFPVVVN